MSRRLPLAAAALAVLTVAPGAQQPVFRTAADVVAIDVLVMNGNRPVAGLTAADFELLDNGVPQTLLEVTRDRHPLDVTLVIDTSGSVHRRLLASLVEAVNTVRGRLREGDRLEVITFSDRLRELVALGSAPGVPRVDIVQASGPTSLNDAIAVALAAPPDLERRRMAIVFTDGVDTLSFLSEAQVVAVARRSRTALFVVATRPPQLMVPLRPAKPGGLRPPPPVGPPEAFFGELADVTGGRLQMVPHVPHFRVTTDGSRMRLDSQGSERLLNAPFLRALEDFRTSYVLRYAPTGVVREGWHDVTVRVPKAGRRWQIRTRQGYAIGP